MLLSSQDNRKDRVVLTFGEIPGAVPKALERWGYKLRTFDPKEIRRSPTSLEKIREGSCCFLVNGAHFLAPEVLLEVRKVDLPLILFSAPRFLTGESVAGAIFPDFPGAEEIRRTIAKLVACPPPQEDASIPLDPFLEFLRQRYGLVFPPRRSREIRDAIRSRMVALRIPTSAAYLDRLQRIRFGDREGDHLLQSLLVGETYLYRTPEHFETLRLKILPEMLRRWPEGPIRALSAGCSSGEEAYCLGAVLLERLPSHRVEVVGVDVHRHALEQANRGVFASYSQRSTLPPYIAEFFDSRESELMANRTLRQVVRFKYLNLSSWIESSARHSEGLFDVVFCRNVLLYFDAETSRRILVSLAERLRPGGVLFLGPSETVLAPDTGLRVRSGLDCFYLEKALASSPPPASSLPKLSESLPPARDFEGPNLERARKLGLLDPKRLPWDKDPKPEPEGSPPESPLRVERWIENGFKQFDEEDFVEAESSFRKALSLNPEALEAEVGMLFLEANQGNLGPALAKGKELASKGANHPRLFYLMGLVSDLKRDHGTARRYFEKALYLDPNCYMARFRLAELKSRDGLDKDAKREARNLLEQLRELEPGSLVPLSGGMSREALETLCLGVLNS